MKSLLTLLFLLLYTLLHAQIYNIVDFGAVGNGSYVNTIPIQEAIDSCTQTGGTVLIPSGVFVSGTIILKSNVTLELADGATLRGSANINNYPDIIPDIRSLADNNSQRALLYAENAENISIIGPGIIDGNGISFLGGGNNRPYGIRIISCTNVRYENIELRNSGFWMMLNQNVDSLVVRNININNNANSNNDGIGIDGCRNVLIEDCVVNSLDDPLVFKAMGPFNCENIIVRNCTLSTPARAIKIGTETVGGFKNMLIENVVVTQHFVGPADCGINLAIVDGGFMDSVVLQNITITGVKTAMFVRLGNRATRYIPTAPTPDVGSLKNLTLRNITITATSNLTSAITGIPGYYAENITLENITINFPGGEAAVAPGFSVPENETVRPNCDALGETIPAHGLFVRHVKNISMNNVCFNANTPDQRPALVTEDVIESELFSIIQESSEKFCINENATFINEVKMPFIQLVADLSSQTLRIQATQESDIKVGILNIFSLDGKRIFSDRIHLNESIVSFHAASGIYVYTIFSDSGKVNGKFHWMK